MPLSEYEQRVLEQMEQQLRSDDPRLVDTISGQGPRRPVTVLLGIALVLAGLGGLVAGVASGHIWIGFIGFLAMFGGVLVAMRRGSGSQPVQRTTGPAKSNAPKGGKKDTNKRPLMDRLDERWDKRRRDR